MPLIIGEDSKKLKNRQVVVPDGVAKKLHQQMALHSNEKTSDGYKRLKSLTDKDYNKRSNKKDRQHNDKMTVSFTDARRIVHDMEHMPQNNTSKEFNMLGGYDTLYAMKNGLRQARSSVKQVSPVPEVPKLEKNPTKTPDIKDTIQMGSAKIQIEGVNKNSPKTVFVTESQLALLKEYRGELNIPFNNPDKPYNPNYNYQHYIDFLEKIGKYGKLEGSKYTSQDIWNKLYDNLWDGIADAYSWSEYISSFNGNDILAEFFMNYYKYDEYFQPNEIIQNVRNAIIENDGEITTDELYDLGIGEDTDINIYKLISTNEYLSEKSREILKDDLIEIGKETLISVFNPHLDSRGLIYIERMITMPDALETRTSNREGEMDYYQELIRNHNSVGTCWAYEYETAEAYCGSSYSVGNSYLILKGYVNPDDVNWKQTVSLNLNNPEEYELRLINGATVEIDGITVETSDYRSLKLPLKGSMLVKA